MSTPRWRVTAARTLVGLALLFVASACSADRSLDGTGLAASVQAQLFADQPGLVSAVNCPDVADPEPGQSFVCAAQLGQQIIDVPVTLGGMADDLTAQANLDHRFVDAASVADMLAETFTAEITIDTQVDCGQSIIVLQPDQGLLCTATDPTGLERLFDVDIDADGQIVLTIR